MGNGYLKVNVRSDEQAVAGAFVTVRDREGRIIYERVTNSDGNIEGMELYAPDKESSYYPGNPGPYYATYIVEVMAKGYNSAVIRGVQVYDKEVSILPVDLVKTLSIPPAPPHIILRQGSKGREVRTLQHLLNFAAELYPAIPMLVVDGEFGSKTRQAIVHFQELFNLKPDGVAGLQTWNELYNVYESFQDIEIPPPVIVPSSWDGSNTPRNRGRQFRTRMFWR